MMQKIFQSKPSETQFEDGKSSNQISRFYHSSFTNLQQFEYSLTDVSSLNFQHSSFSNKIYNSLNIYRPEYRNIYHKTTIPGISSRYSSRTCFQARVIL